jgi:hypothetical protein
MYWSHCDPPCPRWQNSVLNDPTLESPGHHAQVPSTRCGHSQWHCYEESPPDTDRIESSAPRNDTCRCILIIANARRMALVTCPHTRFPASPARFNRAELPTGLIARLGHGRLGETHAGDLANVEGHAVEDGLGAGLGGGVEPAHLSLRSLIDERRRNGEGGDESADMPRTTCVWCRRKTPGRVDTWCDEVWRQEQTK